MNQIAVKIIYDNRKENQAMQEGWGFSCLIDLGHRKILFDTGADKNAFFANLQRLGIHFESITDIVFSHKHSDHVAGLMEILENVKKDSRLFIPKGFPSHGLPLHIQTSIINEFAEIDSQVYSFVLKGGFRLYEQALVIRTSKGLVVITGCAHPGITHLLEVVKQRLDAPIHLVLGGFHLFRKNRRFIDKIVNAFKTLKVENAAPCHCSGDMAIAQFQEVYQEHFCNIGTGTILTLDR
jgi:7,8-dihydropterin-6-yl-methyl-4-(beta-D-ribofuranosyl)aminobenzene 5'-phosphate synthase